VKNFRENKYNDDEWEEIRDRIEIHHLDLSQQSEFIMCLYSFDKKSHCTIEGVQIYLEAKIRSSVCWTKKYYELQQALFGDIKMVPLWMGSQPKIVQWRLEHGK
jgi:hypothetical protein